MSTTNPTRAARQKELADRRQLQMALNKHLQEERVATNCGNCEWREENVCTKFNATPPIHVVVVGCEAWSAAIPF